MTIIAFLTGFVIVFMVRFFFKSSHGTTRSYLRFIEFELLTSPVKYRIRGGEKNLSVE